ncbi:hypothetical protein E5161_16285 [Cohnella pontilimi]|uniref:Cold-shock protein n=1 Tax=Cohnella pontilimi TaxID=2564100 RepID=A0A4V5LRV4_9BACL|nr:cold-shock protein [Cohnella pontilimi]TJY40709.1 hypothetical protein E5161_16285 [Cohnella pontilimi]
MYNSRKKPVEEIPEELTAIWSCTNDACNGWTRANFTFSDQPVCPLCRSEMEKGERMLAVIVNSSPAQYKTDAH